MKGFAPGIKEKHMRRLSIITLFLFFGLYLFLSKEKGAVEVLKEKIKPMTKTHTISSVVLEIEPDVHHRLKEKLQALNLQGYPEKLLLLALKEERLLEVYARVGEGYRLFKSYPFTAFSGQLGPKLREGDRQIPEGIYHIEYLNPNSSFYLSMKVSYPNDFDVSKSKLKTVAEMGGDIFIHGKAVTIGCIPVGDVAIEELFVMVANAREKKKEVKVIISPRDFRRNPNFPSIAAIDWEEELYTDIREAMQKLPL